MAVEYIYNRRQSHVNYRCILTLSLHLKTQKKLVLPCENFPFQWSWNVHVTVIACACAKTLESNVLNAFLLKGHSRSVLFCRQSKRRCAEGAELKRRETSLWHQLWETIALLMKVTSCIKQFDPCPEDCILFEDKSRRETGHWLEHLTFLRPSFRWSRAIFTNIATWGIDEKRQLSTVNKPQVVEVTPARIALILINLQNLIACRPCRLELRFSRILSNIDVVRHNELCY